MLCTYSSLAEDVVMVWGDGITAVAYYWLTYQLLAFAVNSKVSHFQCVNYIILIILFVLTDCKPYSLLLTDTQVNQCFEK